MSRRISNRFIFTDRAYHFGDCMLTTEPPALFVNGVGVSPTISKTEFTLLCLLLSRYPGKYPFEELCEQLYPPGNVKALIARLHVLKHATTQKLMCDYIKAEESAYSISVPDPISIRLANCPDRVPSFVGRKRLLSDLDKVRARSRPDRPQLHVLTGGPELGKSSLATEYAYCHKDEFQFIHWIKADSEDHLRSGLIKLCERALSLKSQAQRDEGSSESLPDMLATKEGLASAVRKLLQTSNDWLVIFDNLRDPLSLSEYLPEKFNGQLLITSREYTGGENRPTGILTFQVPPFTDEEAEQFVWKALDRKDEEPIDDEEGLALREFIKRCGAKPGRLDGQCARVKMAGDRLDTFLSQESAYADSVGTKAQAVECSPQMKSMLRLLHDQYTSELMSLLPFLAAEDIDPRILIPGLRQGSARNKALADAIAVDHENGLLKPLMRARVLQQYKTNEGFRRGRRKGIERLVTFKVHRERQAELLAILSREVQGDLARQMVRILSFALPASEQTSELASDIALYHAQNVSSWPQPLQHHVESRNGVELYERIGAELIRRGRFKEAETCLRRSLRICERLNGGDSADVARAIGFLGLLYMKWGDRPEGERLLRSCVRALGYRSEHERERAYWLRNLAELCWHRAKLKEGMDLFEESLAIQTRMRGGAPDPAREEQLGATQHFYASLMMSRSMDQESEEMFKAALSTKTGLNPLSTEVALSLENYAVLLADQGRHNEALAHARAALRIQHELLGPTHPDVGATCNTLAYILQERAKCDSGGLHSALRYASFGLKLRAKAFQRTHGDVTESLNRIASCHLALGRIREAWKFALRGLAIRLDGKNAINTPSVANSLLSVGEILLADGHRKLAERAFLRSTELIKNSSVAGGRGHAHSLRSLGQLYRDSDRALDAQRLFQKALQIAEAINPSHRLAQDIREDLRSCAIPRTVISQMPTATRSLQLDVAYLKSGDPDILFENLILSDVITEL